ncbi:MAG: ABC transporter substrate-binding protein, partial [Candidatus Bipolaricaulota bacterium]
MRRMAWVVVVLLVATPWTASTQSVSVTDTLGRTVSVGQPVEHIASAYGIGTYYVYALGAGDRLVAAWYVGMKSLAQATAASHAIEPRLGDLLCSGDPSVEDLLARGADLVLVDAAQYTSIADQLEDLGVPALLLAPETAQGVLDTAHLLASVLGEEARSRADALAADFYEVYGRATVAVTGDPAESRPRVLFLGASLSSAAGGAMYQTQLVEAAGGISVSADLPGAWNTVNLEQILMWDPDVVVIAPYGVVTAAEVLSSADWQSVSAVRAGRVHKMPRIFGPMDTPLPESLLGVEWLAAVFHPERNLFDVRSDALAFY